MHLVFSSTDMDQLMNLSIKMKSFVNAKRTCRSTERFKRAFIQHLNRHYRKVPDNIGDIRIMRNPYCILCKNQKNTSQTIRTLKCGHVFHKRCIDNWLIDNRYRCYKCNKCQLT